MLLKLLLFQFVLEATVVDVVGVLVPIGNIDLDDGVVVAPRTNADTGITFAHVLFLLELMSLLL